MMAVLYPCTRCETEVTDEAEAFQCDLCSEWEHRSCIRECDRPSVELYAALTSTQSKVILFVCSKCRRKGDVARRLFQLENAIERANEKCQAAECLICEKQAMIEMLQVDKGALQKEVIRLQDSVDELRRKIEIAHFIDDSASLPELIEPGVTEPALETNSDDVRSKRAVEDQSTVRVKCEKSGLDTSRLQERRLLNKIAMTTLQQEGEWSEDDDHGLDQEINHDVKSSKTMLGSETRAKQQIVNLTPTQVQAEKQEGNVFPYPPDFKQIQERVGRFTGKPGEEDFEVWLADFCEATSDCKWSDVQRAQWFLWFLSGAAKSTWQRTLHKEEKKSWVDIVRVYKGHYGVHMEPHTAYLRCHELRYEDFLSVKGLLGSMKDYQRMAPEQLSDDNLLSILWNKAPYRLQKEVGDIKDWSLQELFERLVRAEARLTERDRRVKADATRKTRKNMGMSEEEDVTPITTQRKSTTSKQGNQGSAETPVRNIKCFKCHHKGHVARDCPQTGTSARVIVTTEGTSSDEECWIRVGVLTAGSESEKTAVSNAGPTYKVEVTVEGLKSRALVDNGSQISLVRTEMLPKLKEINDWSLEECRSKTSKVCSQPLGAGGNKLGAKKIVILSVTLEATGQVLQLPCYVVDSTRPLWQGARTVGLCLALMP